MPRCRCRRAYATDLTDRQWAVIADLVPAVLPGGRTRRAATRELVNPILYALRAGHASHLLPHDFQPWQSVYHYLCRWKAEGVWARIHHAVPTADRERVGREASPSVAIIDSQSVLPPIKRGLERLRSGQEDPRP